MTAQAAAPSLLTPAACPLLSAVLPLRYALGPTLAVDTSAHALPPVQGEFPAIGDYFEPLRGRPLNYTARLLRDGWLYVWQSGLQRLIEYRVVQAVLTQTSRGGKVIDARGLPYLLLPAGESAMLAWSPSQWSDEQFTAAKTSTPVRQRAMRTITPGAAPFSGPSRSIHERIGDYMDANWYGWSCEPSTSHRPAWPGLLEDMQRCEQQAYAVIDDPWGVLLDLAELIRARQQSFKIIQEIRGEDWAMAGVLKSLAESDPQIGGQLPTITDYRKLHATWQEQTQEEDEHTADIRRLGELWAAWLDTLAQRGPASLDTACGHFDIEQPTARTELELHFAAACLGPATTGPGAKAIANALMLQQTGKPWLVWSLLGLGKRLGIGEINALTGLADGARENGANLLDEARKLAELLNQAADKLVRHVQGSALEALFTALAPIAGLGLQRADDGTKAAGRLYMAASLARSQQRLAVEAVSQRQLGEWMSDLMDTRPRLPAHLKPTQLSIAVSDALPFFRLLPAKDLPALSGHLASDVNLKGMLDLSKGALEKAPLKCLVALMAGVNFVWGGGQLLQKRTLKTTFSAAAGTAGLASAAFATLQKIAEVDWEASVRISGATSISSQKALADTLGIGAKTALLQSMTSGFDALVFGIEALEAYQTGDLDTASINAGLTLASATNLGLYVQSFRALRAARAAVIAGEAAALGRGVSVAPHLAARALGVTILIVGGLIARQYTRDTPLEAWVKHTRFGIRPADWAGSYEQSMTEFYKIIFPISFQAYRLNELNPYRGMQTITFVLLRLPGKSTLTDDMIHFKGHETWDSFFGFGGTRKTVEWTGRNFDRHDGTRVKTEPGVAVYRRVYHEEHGSELDAIQGELSYSPIEGLTLPPITIKELAWL